MERTRPPVSSASYVRPTAIADWAGYSEAAINMARLPGWGAGKLKLRSSKDFEPRPIVQTQIVPFVKRVGESSADKPPFARSLL